MLAAFAGAGFSALAVLLLNLNSGPVSMILSILLLPGFLISSSPGSQGVYSPLRVLLGSSVFYGVIAYFPARRFSRTSVERQRLTLILSGCPTLLLVCLCCVPSLNPLWPRMDHLVSEENELREGLPVGAQLDQARAFLRERGIEAYEEPVKVRQEVARRSGPSFVVQPGDRLVSARITTDAGQFPCGYAIEVGLVFDSSDKLRGNHIDELRLCP